MKDGKHLVLCIDDDKDVLDALRLMIEDAGYSVATASSAEEGLRTYKHERPDFVLVDLMMEEIDSGTNFVKEVRALGEAPPVVMLSSVGDNLDLNIDYNELGLAGVLQKPIDPGVLLNTLKAKLPS